MSKLNPCLDTRGKLVAAALVASLAMAGCTSTPTKPEGAEDLRMQLTQLQTDPLLGARAPIAMKQADEAVRAAEQPREDADDATSNHLVFVAKARVEIAQALALRELYESQREDLTEKRYAARLQSRTQELQSAHMQTTELQRQLAELNARATERGIVMTLGDVLFTTGRAELKPGAVNNLAKLLAFLNEHPDSSLAIEGHTDSVGGESYNLGLSLQRAESVKAYLVSQGISPDRISSLGKGETFPVADNASSAGRQLNRRVEVIITDATEH